MHLKVYSPFGQTERIFHHNVNTVFNRLAIILFNRYTSKYSKYYLTLYMGEELKLRYIPLLAAPHPSLRLRNQPPRIT